MPWFGLGVFQVEDGNDVIQSVKAAIKNGYRSIDTAAVYGNEEGVGQAIREAMEEYGVTRQELFITSKVWNADQGYEETLKAYETSLQKLGLDYLDLYLIHWPVEDKMVDTWKALEALYKEEKVRAIGVCNFQIHHLETLMKEATVVPMVNQVEMHPKLSQAALHEFSIKHNIQLEAWAPLMQGGIFDMKELQDLATKYGRTVAQIVLRWDLQRGIVTIPKSVKESRIIENADVFNFELSPEDMNVIDALNEDHRVGPDPDNFDF
ncbi:aldo/keto reductase [Priestia koreensis]|uniref:aldo/keto reductase n=1 Tax=Priestia koreensis TaxID=284581 RepID=UPI001F59CDA2|nr:aldo/keto reductase [Priestia koreensis]MCM3003520.1 aldo/keto reductase [Priestia koreensis]UNL87182.1 aldo/keto reductase [Priestia koreensis]